MEGCVHIQSVVLISLDGAFLCVCDFVHGVHVKDPQEQGKSKGVQKHELVCEVAFML